MVLNIYIDILNKLSLCSSKTTHEVFLFILCNLWFESFYIKLCMLNNVIHSPPLSILITFCKQKKVPHTSIIEQGLCNNKNYLIFKAWKLSRYVLQATTCFSSHLPASSKGHSLCVAILWTWDLHSACRPAKKKKKEVEKKKHSACLHGLCMQYDCLAYLFWFAWSSSANQ